MIFFLTLNFVNDIRSSLKGRAHWADNSSMPVSQLPIPLRDELISFSANSSKQFLPRHNLHCFLVHFFVVIEILVKNDTLWKSTRVLITLIVREKPSNLIERSRQNRILGQRTFYFLGQKLVLFSALKLSGCESWVKLRQYITRASSLPENL